MVEHVGDRIEAIVTGLTDRLIASAASPQGLINLQEQTKLLLQIAEAAPDTAVNPVLRKHVIAAMRSFLRPLIDLRY